jgi:predicted porin
MYQLCAPEATAFTWSILAVCRHGMSNMDGYLSNARSDNAIAYLGKFAELSIGATYSSGRGSASSGGPSATNCAGEIAGNPSACRQFSTLLDYDSDRYGLASAYDKLYGGPNALAGLNSIHYFVERCSLNGYRWIGKTKVGAGWIQRKTQAAQVSTANVYYLGVSQPLEVNWIVDTQVSYLGVQNTSDSSIQLSARLIYQLSKRTTVYGLLVHINDKGNAAIAVSAGASVRAEMSQSSVMTSIRHSF